METFEKIENNIKPVLSDKYDQLVAKTYDSRFIKAHDTYNSISTGSDGKIYYVLSSESIEVGGKMYVFDPANESIDFLGDLTEICGEQHLNALPQGKSHVRFYESKGKLYFATHVGFYELINGMDRLPENPPKGFKLYPGGHFISYDIKARKFDDLAIVPNGEGVVSMTMDREREQIYGLTWPSGNFIHYDVKKNVLKDLGLTSGKGEAGTPGHDFRSLCRSLFVNPATGTVYFSSSEGDIFSYNAGDSRLKKLEDVDLRLDYFGKYDPSRPGNMGYNWRKIFWYPPGNVAYGVHGNSGYLFRFDPSIPSVELVTRISSQLSQKSGMFDQFSYGYLGFQLGPDNKTIYFLTGGPIYINGKRLKGEDEIAKGAAKGLENLHLITYQLHNGEYRDHGPVFYENGERPLYVNSIAIGNEGSIYSLARIARGNSMVTDLIRIPNPFTN